jgi:hypothetical protein
MSEHQKETAFLRQCIRYEESSERQELEEGITQIQRDERCVWRAAWLMVMLLALVGAGLGYGVALVDNFPYNVPHLIINTACALGFVSFISLLVFVVLGIAYRQELAQRREKCRQLVTKIMESRLGKPVPAPWHEGRVGDMNRESVRQAAEGLGFPDQTASTASG